MYNITHVDRQIVKPITKQADIISFQIPESQLSWTKCEFILRSKWCILNGDEKLKADDNVTASAYALYSMFRQCTLMFSETVVGDQPANGFPLLAYILNRFTFSDSARVSQNDLMFGYPDTPGESEVFSSTQKVNQGYWERNGRTALSTVVTTQGPLPFSICQAGKVLPPGLRISINLLRAADGLALCSPSAIGKNYKIEIQDIELEITRYRLVQDLVDKMYDAWRDRQFISYQYQRNCMIGPIEIPLGQNLINRLISTGQRPSYILLFFVSSAAANGAYARNIFRFHHLRATKLQVMFESSYFPNTAYTPIFPESPGARTYDVTREYAECLRVLGLLNENNSNGITMAGWMSDCTLFGFTLNETENVDPVILEPKPQTGQLRITGTLGIAPTENFQMWMVAGYYSTVRISPDLCVGMDHSPSVPS